MNDETRKRDDFLTENLALRQHIAELEAQQTTSKSEACLREAQRLARIGNWELDLVSDTLVWSDEMYRIFEIDPSEFGASYEAVLSYIHPEDRDAVKQAYTESLVKKEPYGIIHRLKLKDGRIKYLHARCTTSYDEQGKPIRSSGTVQDITDRKKTEEALRKSEERLELVLQGGDLGWWDFHVPTGQILTNERAAAIVGYTLDEIGQRMNFWESILHPDDRQWVLDHLRDRLAGLVDTSELEYRVRHKNGDWRWVLSRGKTTEREPDGKVLRISGTFLDITDRKKAREALRESEELYRSLFEAAGDGIFVMETDEKHRSRILSANPAAAEMHGYTVDELLTLTMFDLETPECTGALEPLRNERFFSGEVIKQEVTHRKKDGTLFYIESTARVLELGGLKCVLAIDRDITRRKRAEEALLSAQNELQRRVDERTAELKNSEEKYKALVEESFDGILVHDGSKIMFTNARLREMLGYGEGELEGQYPWLICSPEYREIMREMALARLQGQLEHSRHEVRMQRKDGSSFEAEINARKVKYGGETGIQTWIRDISDRKLAENALRESEERFRIAFQTSPDPIAITRLSDGVFIEINKGFTDLNGFTRDEVIGKSSRDINIWYDPADRDRLIAGLKDRGHVTNLEARFRQKDGQVWAGLMSASIIVLGAEPHILTLTRDVEDWKKAEQDLRESNEKYRALFEQSRDAVFMSTREGILVDANQAFLDLFGLSREEARSMDVLRIYPDPAERRRFQDEIERKESLKDYEISFRKSDGTRIEGLLTSTVRRDKDGTVLGYHGIVRDVTGLKQIQRQLLHAQKMEAVGTLAGGIAHDFNNLLQAILGYTDLLLMRTKKTDPDRRKLEIVRQAARDGGDLVSRLLTVSMKAELNARPTDLNEEVMRVEKLLRRTIPRMIAIDLVLADDLLIINADSAQIEQVLLNLAVNAQHAMPDGGRLLIETNNVSLGSEYMRTHLDVKPGNYVLLTVSDTGTGMVPEVVDRIFEPFFTTKASGEGTGLGLAMVHGIVSQHGGYIRCYSEPGLGTSFKIYFPASQTERLLGMAETREMPAFGTETILLVDDDTRIRDIAREIIEMGGYTVIEASSGEEALETYAAHRDEVSLVVLDLIMPGMGGKRCLEELLRINPSLKVLFASGYSSNGLRLDETGTGAIGFVKKPYDTKGILIAIRKVLDCGRL